MTILIVEDSPKTLMELEKMIKQNIDCTKNNIITTTKGLTAIEIARKINIDIFIVDIDLPDINGLNLSCRLRKKYKHNPIIVESSVDDNSFQVKVHKQIENLAYLVKPYTQEEFIGKLITAMEVAEKTRLKRIKIIETKRTTIFDIDDIICVEKIKNCKKIKISYIQSNNILKSDIFHMSLNQFKNILKKNDLIQIHRNFMINPSYIGKIDFVDNYILLKYIDDQLPIGTTFYECVKYVS